MPFSFKLITFPIFYQSTVNGPRGRTGASVTSPVQMEHSFAHVRVQILNTADITVRDSTKRAWNVCLLNAQVIHVPFWFLVLVFV